MGRYARHGPTASRYCFAITRAAWLMRQTRHRGLDRVDWMFTFATAAYNLIRIRNLMRARAAA